MLDFDDMGRAEGRQVGPKPGQGAVLHHCSGEADFGGLPGDELPTREAVARHRSAETIPGRARSATSGPFDLPPRANAGTPVVSPPAPSSPSAPPQPTGKPHEQGGARRPRFTFRAPGGLPPKVKSIPRAHRPAG
jgi:hypothetical protein